MTLHTCDIELERSKLYMRDVVIEKPFVLSLDNSNISFYGEVDGACPFARVFGGM